MNRRQAREFREAFPAEPAPDLIPNNITTVPGVGFQCERCGCRLQFEAMPTIGEACALMTLAVRKHARCLP